MAAPDLYPPALLEHSKRPHNYGPLARPTVSAKADNPVCGDSIDLQLCIQDDRIVEIGFTARGCAICKASASLMTCALKNLSDVEARNLQSVFRTALCGDKTSGKALQEPLSLLLSVRDFPIRIKCALLPWDALSSCLPTSAK